MNTTKKPLPTISELENLPKEELIEVIKQYLNELCDHGIKKSVIARKVGLSRVSIWRIQNGLHKTTHLDHGLNIAHLYATTIEGKRAAPRKI